MPRGFAWLLGIAVMAAAWWLAGHPGWETRAQARQHEKATQAMSTPKLYRWRDENGVTQITQTPPKGRKYKVVNIRDDQNVFETATPATEPPQ
jgi:hypothetical protein